MAKVRCFFADLIGDIKVDFHAALVSDRRQMQHTVGRTAQRHIHRQRIHQSLFGHNVTGTDIFLKQFHDRHARMFGKLNAGGIHSGDRTVAFQSHTKSLG